MVLDTLRGWLASYSAGIDPFPQRDLTEQLRTSLKQFEKHLSDLDTRVNRAFELVETGVYTPEIYVERKNALDAERVSMMKQITNIEAELKKLENEQAIRQEFLPKLCLLYTS